MLGTKLYAQNMESGNSQFGRWKQSINTKTQESITVAASESTAYLTVFADSTYTLAIFDEGKYMKDSCFLYFESGYWVPLSNKSFMLKSLLKKNNSADNNWFNLEFNFNGYLEQDSILCLEKPEFVKIR
jgi:hypothetical protein